MILKFAGGAFAVFFILAVAAVIVLRLTFGPCQNYVEVLSKNAQGYAVRSTMEACFPGSNAERLELILPSGRAKRFMTYSPWGGVISMNGKTSVPPYDPVVTWDAPDKLRITIGTVGSISEMKDLVGGIHVSYEISVVLYP